MSKPSKRERRAVEAAFELLSADSEPGLKLRAVELLLAHEQQRKKLAGDRARQRHERQLAQIRAAQPQLTVEQVLEAARRKVQKGKMNESD
jgi:hypothetical protein